MAPWTAWALVVSTTYGKTGPSPVILIASQGTTTSQPTGVQNPNKPQPIWPIVIGVLGGLTLLASVAAVVVIFRRRKRRNLRPFILVPFNLNTTQVQPRSKSSELLLLAFAISY